MPPFPSLMHSQYRLHVMSPLCSAFVIAILLRNTRRPSSAFPKEIIVSALITSLERGVVDIRFFQCLLVHSQGDFKVCWRLIAI